MSNKRRISKLLPEFMQANSQLSKFFNSTVDPLFQPESKKKMAGYVGRVPSYYDEADTYIIEPTQERQFYQLEPSMVSSEVDIIAYIQTYPDLINHLRFQGANVDNHSRMFEQKYWAWSPPIDIDKFTNYNSYYWYPEGPTAITIAGNISNTINVTDDILASSAYTSPNGITFINGMKITFGNNVTPAYQSKSYIVEGVGESIILVDVDNMDDTVVPLEVETTPDDKDYVVIGRGSNDNNPWSRTDHWYHKNTLTFLSDTGAIATETSFLWDADAEPWDSTPWDAVVTALVPAFNLDPARKAQRPIIEFNRSTELFNYGVTAREVSYIDETTTDAFSQIHGQAFGSVSYDGSVLIVSDTILLTVDTNGSVNNRVYTVGSIEVTPNNFVYTLTLNTDGQDVSGDPVLKEKALQMKGSSAGIEYYYDGTEFIAAQRKTSRNQAPMFNLYDVDGNYLGDDNLYPLSSFIGSKIFSYKEGDTPDAELGFSVEYRNFDQIAEIVFSNDILDRSSYESAPLTRENINGYYFYKTTKPSGDEYGNTWYGSSEKSTQSTSEGFYSIPLNLQGNPNYDNVETITRSEGLSHFAAIILNQDNIIGDNFANTNYRNTAEDYSKGDVIVHNEAAMLKLMLMASDDRYDYMQSVSYVANEYKRFRNRFVNKANTLIAAGQDVSNIATFVDDIMAVLNVAKHHSSLFPFNDTRISPFGKEYDVVESAGTGSTYSLPPNTAYDVSKIKQTSTVSVYVNGDIQIINYDYSIVNNIVTLTTAASATDTVEVRYYPDVRGSYIPATGSALGLTPVFKPIRMVDDTYSESQQVIQCHDGSYHFVYNNEVDAAVLELETRIYNTILDKFKGDNRVALDEKDATSGFFRETEYSNTDVSEILTPIFSTWAVDNNIDWTANTENELYDQGDWKTWNWTGTPYTAGGEASGSWRAIYLHYFDTDRPHITPWEMLGFSEQPSWWSAEYGNDYGSTNLSMWEDLQAGFIRQGDRQGVDSRYARSGLYQYVPVDASGSLLSPTAAGITLSNATVVAGQADWHVGDMSPAETSFWRSSERSFFKSKINYLLSPAKWSNLGWNTETLRYLDIVDQYIDTDFGYRPQSAEMTLVDDGIVKHGIAEWIINSLQSQGISVEDTLEKAMQGMNVALSWKAASFIYDQNLKFQADSYSPTSSATTQTIFVRDDDVDVETLESNSIKETFYSGVIIEWTGTGYQVYGYDTVHPFFKTSESDNLGSYNSVSVGSETVKQYKTVTESDIEIPYGYEFDTKQDLFDFLISYGRNLESQGWMFDDFDTTSNEILNWRYAGKEFLFWAEDTLKAGAFITLSPVANKLTFHSEHGMVQNVEKISRGTYAVVNGNGEPIAPHLTDAYREDNTFTLTDLSQEGIYGLRLSIKEIENIVVLKNVTRFNDTIYNPLLNLRQQRMKIFTQASDGWKGRYDADGFMIDRNSDKNLIPNFEKTAEDFRNYFDIENPSENDDITDIARHQIGYQTREYLDGLLIDRDTQYQFYQGFIQQKGSRNTLNRMFRSTAITSSSDVNFLEEWAFRVAEYGAVESNKYFELFLNSDDIRSNPQIVRFTSGSKSDSPNDVIIDVGLSDPRWHASNDIANVDKFVNRNVNEFFKRDLPNAGYPMVGETDYMLAYSSDITTSDDFKNAKIGESVWIAIDDGRYLSNNGWDVQVLTPSSQYAFTDVSVDDGQTFKLYDKFTFYGDGVTTEFTVDTNVLEENDFVYYVDGVEVFNVSSVYKIVTFDSPPALDAVIDIYAIDYTPVVQDVIRVNIENNTATHLIESVNGRLLRVRNSIAFLSKTPIDVWKSSRFASDINPDESGLDDSYIYYDDFGSNGWAVYKNTSGSSRIIRKEVALVDNDKLSNAVIFDIETDSITAKASIFDPFKGIIPGTADADITYKLEYDPARYTHGTNAVESERVWGKNQLGKVWWDLSTVAYLNYEMGTLEYKHHNWGKIFPNTSVDVYEWVRSPVPPASWVDYVEGSVKQYTYDESGVVKDIDTEDGPLWVEHIEGENTYYYFWVKDKIAAPNSEFRSTSVFDIAKIIRDPQSEGIKWAAAMDTNVFMISNIETDLSVESSVLQFNYTESNADSAIHHQWELLRENDEFSYINDRHWNKMRDSLVGYDDLGKEVPDIRLKGNSRYGHQIRPRQTWFKDRLSARQIIIEAVNTMLADINLVDSVLNYEDVISQKDSLAVAKTIVDGTVLNPTVTAGEQLSINGFVIIFSGINGFTGVANDINYVLQGSGITASIEYTGSDAFIRITEENGNSLNIISISGNALASIGLSGGITAGDSPSYTVPNLVSRGALLGLEINDTVLVEEDETLFQYWTYWQYNGGGAVDSSNWTLVNIQSFDTTKYWNQEDWYATGYASTFAPSIIFTSLAERNNSNSEEAAFVKVLDDGSGSWAWYVRTDVTWLLVAKENATIQFSDALYDSYVFGFDQELLDTLPFDDVPNVEFRNIMDAIRNNIFVGSHVVSQNILFFKMVNHAHATNCIVDWAFKTSYLFVVGFSENIEQTPIYTGDGFEAMIAYINEAKPYHTKIKDIMRTFATVVDSADATVIDWDNPTVDGVPLDILDADDLAILNTEPWINWLNEYETDLRPSVARSNNVRKIKTSVKFDRISAIREDYIPALQFVNHPDYPDVLAPTPYYASTVDSTTAKDEREISFINNYTGSITEILENSASGYDFFWKFNGSLVDESVNVNSGTMATGAATYGDSLMPATTDQSFVFDGNREITVTNDTKINTAAFSSKSISFAFNASAIHEASPQVIFKQGSTTSGINFTIHRSGSISTLYATVYETGGVDKDILQTTIYADRDYFVTYQLNATTSSIELYVNGVLVDSKMSLNVSDTVSSDTGNVAFGGVASTSVYGPFNNTALDASLSKFQGRLQYFGYFHEKNISDAVDLWEASQFQNIIHNVVHVPFNKYFVITTSGTVGTSALSLYANTEPDFTGTDSLIATFSAVGDTVISTSEYTGSPYMRMNLETGFVYGDDITITANIVYENTLSRLLDYYTPSTSQPSIQDLMSSYYLGTIVDGFTLAIDYGWDSTPWGYAGWDFDTDIVDLYDTVINGGAYDVYVGDGATNTYNLPAFGAAPWYVGMTDAAGAFVQELVVDTDYSIVGTQLVLINAAQSWLTGADLTTGYKITIMDSTYLAANDYEVIVDGYKIVGPTVSGYPEEITPLIVTDSTVLTVVTGGSLDHTIFTNVVTAATSEPFTFNGVTPINITISGISGDTVIIEGSNSGAFTGEETTIASVTTNSSTIIPSAGLVAYANYRLRISVYGSGIINASASLNYAPLSSHVTDVYNATAGTGPYEVDNNIIAADDMLVTLNGTFLEHTVDYAVDTGNDQFTFTAAKTINDVIDVVSWNTTNVVNTDPTWVSQTYTSATIDLSAINVDPSPTEPRDNSMFVFGDTGAGFRRLTPPEAIYMTGNGINIVAGLNGKFAIGSANIDVWNNNTLMTGAGTDYTYDEGGYAAPEAAVNAGGSGYTVGDVLTVVGGTGTATTLTVLTVLAGVVLTVAVSNAGLYSVTPTNAVSVTGGTGTLATFDLTNWSEIPDTLTFTVAPALNDLIGIRILGNEDYSINPASDVLTVSAGLTLTTDDIAFYSFRAFDSSMGLQTKVFDGNSTLDGGGYVYPLDSIPQSKDRLIVTVYTSGGTIGGVKLTPADYTIEHNVGTWDINGWDDGSWDDSRSIVKLNASYNAADKIVITSFTGVETLATHTYREIVSTDNNEFFHELVRFGDMAKTTISSTVLVDDTTISVTDANIFDEDGGIIWINSERIEYITRTGGATPGAAGTLTGLVRGSKGTRKNKTHVVGATVRRGDDVIPYGTSRMFNEINTRLQESDTIGAKYIVEDTGGYGSWV